MISSIALQNRKAGVRPANQWASGKANQLFKHGGSSNVRVTRYSAASYKRDNEITDEHFTTYSALDKKASYLQMKMSAEGFGLLNAFKPIHIPSLVAMRRTTIYSMIKDFTDLLNLTVEVTHDWATCVDLDSKIMLISTTGEKRSVDNMTFGGLLGYGMEGLQVINGAAVMTRWFKEHSSGYYDVEVSMRGYAWLCNLADHKPLIDCSHHPNSDFKGVTLADYYGERMLNFNYPTAAATASNKICTCGDNMWILLSRAIPVQVKPSGDSVSSFLGNVCLEDLKEAPVFKTKGVSDANVAATILNRIFGSLEIEFYNHLLLNQAGKNGIGPYVDMSEAKMTGVDLGTSVKTCSDELAFIANMLRLSSKVYSITHGHSQKPSLAIVVAKHAEDGKQEMLEPAVIKKFMHHILPIFRMVLNCNGVYDFCVVSHVRRSVITTQMDLMLRPLMPMILKNLYSSSFLVETNVNANIVVETRAWYAEGEQIVYDQDMGSAYGLALTNQILTNMKTLPEKLKVRANVDLLGVGSVVNGDLRTFINIHEAFEKPSDVILTLSSTLTQFLKDHEFHIGVMASLIASLTNRPLGSKPVPSTKYYFQAAVKCKRMIPAAGTKRETRIQDIFALPLKTVDMSAEAIRSRMKNDSHLSPDGVSHHRITEDATEDVTTEVINALDALGQN